jgi:hypothetical protein
MTHDTFQKKTTSYGWYVCQKCKSQETATSLVIVPKQLIILCEDCFLHYSKIFPIEDREFVRDGYERYRYD